EQRYALSRVASSRGARPYPVHVVAPAEFVDGFPKQQTAERRTCLEAYGRVSTCSRQDEPRLHGARLLQCAEPQIRSHPKQGQDRTAPAAPTPSSKHEQ